MEQTRPISGLLATLGLVTSAGAVFAASCCVLPLVLGSLGASASIFTALEVLTDYRKPVLFLGASLVALAWVIYFRRSGAKATAIALTSASLLIATAASWDFIERPLLKIVRTYR
ncbi:hypothetical protein FNL55_00335 [Tardiphaga sp. vice352]|uniref:hypothetical protein n=1 Tax=unclassified Tardiphaga TaxID=2631404 RepID=UPI00116487E8|nr:MULTISPECIES: hypothetical protein [unclassified Tardiphaga]QDM14570.1 hypothetical protein FNL53_00330 [Tardiphaga sp. vice278]QDM24767.1 hypothetical protein FNL56_00330 [Tardiphaga sp. vice304]QDM29960.1 hypothetical protein FNL55_00335 [Tardiphaga sp. vice352]